jgi:hypothetical protein
MSREVRTARNKAAVFLSVWYHSASEPCSDLTALRGLDLIFQTAIASFSEEEIGRHVE